MTSIEKPVLEKFDFFLNSQIQRDTRVEIKQRSLRGNEPDENFLTLTSSDLKEFPSTFFLDRSKKSNPLPDAEYELHNIIQLFKTRTKEGLDNDCYFTLKKVDRTIIGTIFSKRWISDIKNVIETHKKNLPILCVDPDCSPDADTLRFIISNPTFNLNAKFEYKGERSTLLHLAVRSLASQPNSNPRKDIFLTLLNHSGVNLETKDSLGQNVCHLAGSLKCEKAITELCKCPFKIGINEKTLNQCTPIRIVIENNFDKGIITLLSTRQVKLAPSDNNDCNLLALAASKDLSQESLLKLYHSLDREIPSNDFKNLFKGSNSPLIAALSKPHFERTSDLDSYVKTMTRHRELNKNWDTTKLLFQFQNKRDYGRYNFTRKVLWKNFNEAEYQEAKKDRAIRFFLETHLVHMNPESHGGKNPLFLAVKKASPELFERFLNKAKRELPKEQLWKMLDGREEKNALNCLLDNTMPFRERDFQIALMICKESGAICTANQLAELIYPIKDEIVKVSFLQFYQKLKKNANFWKQPSQLYKELIETVVSKLSVEDINTVDYQFIVRRENIKEIEELKSPLIFLALEKRDAIAAKILFNHPSLDCTVKNALGENMLHMLSNPFSFKGLNEDDPALIKAIFKKMIEMNLAQEKSNEGLTPTEKAAKNNHFEFAKLAIESAQNAKDLSFAKNLFKAFFKEQYSDNINEKIEVLNCFLESFSSLIESDESMWIAKAGYMTKAFENDNSKLRDNLLKIKKEYLSNIIKKEHWKMAIKKYDFESLQALCENGPNLMDEDILKMVKEKEEMAHYLKEKYSQHTES